MSDKQEQVSALVIGAGPAGLMAASQLAGDTRSVIVADAKPSIGRKFLMAGKSGLNLTKHEPFEEFLSAYRESTDWLAPMLRAFGPEEIQSWARGLGQELFTGSTGRVFPVGMKASPLLRAWARDLANAGVDIRTRWRWSGWSADGADFQTPDGPRRIRADVTVLALGGASWARLGSDGQWVPALNEHGIETAPFEPANFGLSVPWSEHMRAHFGAPVKGTALSCGTLSSRGEFVISAQGLEGGAIYALGPELRAGAPLYLDLLPDLTVQEIATRLAKPRGKASISNHLRRALRLTGARAALLQEFCRPLPTTPDALAATLKAIPVAHAGPRPIDEAISTAGGVPRSALDDNLMLKAMPGVYCAGEMLDWEAPTGGYLLSACLATGRWAGRAASERIEHAAKEIS